MNFRVNRVPRHSSFNYTPRYYDPEKEKRAERRARDYSPGNEAETLKRRIAMGFDRSGGSQFQFRTQRSAANAASNRRLLMIICGMALIAYLLLEANVEGLIRALE